MPPQRCLSRLTLVLSGGMAPASGGRAPHGLLPAERRHSYRRARPRTPQVPVGGVHGLAGWCGVVAGPPRGRQCARRPSQARTGPPPHRKIIFFPPRPQGCGGWRWLRRVRMPAAPAARPGMRHRGSGPPRGRRRARQPSRARLARQTGAEHPLGCRRLRWRVLPCDIGPASGRLPRSGLWCAGAPGGAGGSAGDSQGRAARVPRRRVCRAGPRSGVGGSARGCARGPGRGFRRGRAAAPASCRVGPRPPRGRPPCRPPAGQCAASTLKFSRVRTRGNALFYRGFCASCPRQAR
jgi:hypothetical protein